MINNDGSDSKTSGGKKGVRWQGTRQDFGLRSIKKEAGGRTEFPKSAYWEYLDPGGVPLYAIPPPGSRYSQYADFGNSVRPPASSISLWFLMLRSPKSCLVPCQHLSSPLIPAASQRLFFPPSAILRPSCRQRSLSHCHHY